MFIEPKFPSKEWATSTLLLWKKKLLFQNNFSFHPRYVHRFLWLWPDISISVFYSTVSFLHIFYYGHSSLGKLRLEAVLQKGKNLHLSMARLLSSRGVSMVISNVCMFMVYISFKSFLLKFYSYTTNQMQIENNNDLFRFSIPCCMCCKLCFASQQKLFSNKYTKISCKSWKPQPIAWCLKGC